MSAAFKDVDAEVPDDDGDDDLTPEEEARLAEILDDIYAEEPWDR